VRLPTNIVAVEITLNNPNAPAPGATSTTVSNLGTDKIRAAQVDSETVVKQLVAIVNQLSSAREGQVGCTAEGGIRLYLKFYNASEAKPAATAVEDPSCAILSLQVDGMSSVGLKDDQGLFRAAVAALGPAR
jgi:hypothetical protein